jgi:hypothetical protein
MPRTKAVKKKASPELCGYSHALIPIILEQSEREYALINQHFSLFHCRKTNSHWSGTKKYRIFA